MASTVQHSEYFTGVDADMLNGTPVENAPGHGVYIVKIASTVNTAILSIKSGGRQLLADAMPIPLRANGVPEPDDQPLIIPVVKGQKLDMELGGTTGTCRLVLIWVGR